MSKELAVAVIHGMGTQDRGFANPMIAELKDWLGDLGKDPDEVAWESIYWADILITRQREYFRAARQANDLDYELVRKLVINMLGDAAAYQKVQSTANTTYDQIHDNVGTAINKLHDATKDPNGSNATPLIVLAHSLGGHIMSNYIWDAQHSSAAPSPFEGMETLSGIVTFGCNIPLFTFAYDVVEPIDFPSPTLPAGLTSKAKWLNYFDPDDVLGYPLKPINTAYDAVVDEDNEINVGGFFTSWNPASHLKYWTDNDFTKPTSEFIASFL